MDLSSQWMLADAALVLWARERLAELVDALTVDLGDQAAAAGLRRGLDEVHPEWHWPACRGRDGAPRARPPRCRCRLPGSRHDLIRPHP